MCLDKLLQGGECLIYSFGLSYDWTFEEMLDSAGLDLNINRFPYQFDLMINQISKLIRTHDQSDIKIDQIS